MHVKVLCCLFTPHFYTLPQEQSSKPNLHDRVWLVLSSACRLDIAMVLDASGSVTNSGWRKLVNSMADFVSLIEIGENATRIGVVAFGMYYTLQHSAFPAVMVSLGFNN